ncbi:hypothetical protein D3C78_1886060 [compost metagenome]
MPFGIVEVIGEHRAIGFGLLAHQLGKARDRLVLHREVLAVFEYQVDEHPLDRP